MSGSQESPQEQGTKNDSRQRPYGAIALTLWGLAAVCSVVDALLFYDRIKVLLFTGGLLMMDIAAAVLVSLMRFLDKRLLGPLATYQAGLEYGFRAGQISRHRRQAEMHLLPMVWQRAGRDDYVASNGTKRIDD